MTTTTKTHKNDPARASEFEDLPHDEMLRYGRALGLDLEEHILPDELKECVRQHLGMLQDFDRDALLDIIKWSRRPVRVNASKEALACEIARIQQTNYDSLSRRGLVTLARLRGISALESENTEDIIDKLRKANGLWQRLHHKRRSVIGSWLSKMFDGKEEPTEESYQFLPEELDDGKSLANRSLKRQIEDHGVVGGIASRLRGAADDYIKIKMDEIELRIDTKLSEIDQRLGEWRDREVANRLKILRITLAFTVLVAILSLGYNTIKKQVDTESPVKVEQVVGEDSH